MTTGIASPPGLARSRATISAEASIPPQRCRGSPREAPPGQFRWPAQAPGRRPPDRPGTLLQAQGPGCLACRTWPPTADRRSPGSSRIDMLLRQQTSGPPATQIGPATNSQAAAFARPLVMPDTGSARSASDGNAHSRLLRRLHAGSVSGQTRSRCPAGRSHRGCPPAVWVWLSSGLRTAGRRDEAWLKRGLPSS